MSYPILYSKNEGVRTPAIAGIAVVGLTVVGDFTEQKTAFENQGLGTLSDAITCTVNEKRNGEYELEMQYPISGVHFSEIEQRSFILAKPNYTDDPQPFRVYKITKPLNGVCTIYARHISYDLSGFEMPAGRTASGLSATCALLTKYASPFKITTTRSATGAFKTNVPATVRSWLGGKQGSVLDLFGGEWHWDGYECKLATNRGTNRGVTIRYGKNLTELTQETSCDNLYTKIRPYYVDADNNVISGHLVATGLHLDETRTLFLDCSEHFGTTVPTKAQLTSYAQTYAQANNLTVPDINITLDFVQLEGLAERVDLCDTVKVEYEALGVSATEKCIEVTWDVIKDRYTKAVFGTVKQNIVDTVIRIQEKAEEAVSPSVLEQSVERATSLITGNRGGYVVMHDSDGNGEPDEILIMNTPDINTATKVWRWNKNGLGYSSTGYDGDYGLAMTADGQIVANFITAGTMLADRIKGGTLVLGGTDNGDGVIEVYDKTGNLIGRWDNDGIFAANGEFTGTIVSNNATITGGTINIEGAASDSIITLSTPNKVYETIIRPQEIIRHWNSPQDGKPNTTIRMGQFSFYVTAHPNTSGYSEDIIAADLGINGIRLRKLTDGQISFSATLQGDVTCVSVTQTSDKNFKENISELSQEDATKFIYALKPSMFKLKDREGVHHGFIAQDVESIADWDIVHETEGVKSLAYTEIIADLVATVQSLNNRIAELEAKEETTCYKK